MSDFIADVHFKSSKAETPEDLKKENLGLPRFQVNRSIGKSEIVDRMKENIAEFSSIPRFKCRTKMSVCGYGPSLAETYRSINPALPIMTTSGAHDFLLDRGITPTWHIECDPRPHKTFFIEKSHPDVTYLIASVCHPDMFRKLLAKKRNVVMWHAVTDVYKEQLSALREIEYGAHMVGGGSNAGLRAMLLAYHMGFRDIDCHGIDFSYGNDNKVWAGEHSGQQHYMMEVECNGRIFWSSDTMMNACQDFFELMHSRYMGGCHFILHGEGLLAERVKLAATDKEAADHDWVKPVIVKEVA